MCGLAHVLVYICIYRRKGFALTGYDIPECMVDGDCMLLGNSSIVIALTPTIVVPHLRGGGGGWQGEFEGSTVFFGAKPLPNMFTTLGLSSRFGGV